MPSFNIHLAVAKEYMKKNKVKNKREFLRGTIRPDMNENLNEICPNKEKTHFGVMGNKNDGFFYTDINLFLNNINYDIDNDFNKGYLLHLLTDYYFYNKYFKKEFLEVIKNHDKFHHDYDSLNKYLEEKYDIILPDNLKKFTGYNNDIPRYLKIDKLESFINDMSSIDLYKFNVKNNNRGLEK